MEQNNVNRGLLSASNPVSAEQGNTEPVEETNQGLQTVTRSIDKNISQAMPNHLAKHPTQGVPSQVPSQVPSSAPDPSAPSSVGVASAGPNQPHHPVAEFLYQLTKMLTDDNNEIIEWVDGRIKVHFPERLESEVLHKYFRHSKFASFQRQLNYFGFRKIAGKGKMSPCSYVNESATSDIRSLLLIKRNPEAR